MNSSKFSDTSFTDPFRQVLFGLSVLFSTVVGGTIAYMIIEGWDVLDSAYMVIITISTTGFKEVHELTRAGRILTLVLIVLGVGSLAYTSGRSIQLIVETGVFRRRRMQTTCSPHCRRNRSIRTSVSSHAQWRKKPSQNSCGQVQPAW